MLVTIGSVPWMREDMIGRLGEFASLYEERPFATNKFGMGSHHMFLAWFVLQYLQPQAIVESGVLYGQGSWFFERACPEAELYCIEPAPERIGYRPAGATYYEQDFSALNWDHLPKDNTVLFFDDHQNAYGRVQQIKRFGFTHAIFEDNYPYIQRAGCYSLKAAFEADPPGHGEYLRQNLEVYHELPPVFKTEQTRWGDVWADEDYPTPKPLLAAVEEEYQQLFWDDAKGYTWMCYAKIVKK